MNTIRKSIIIGLTVLGLGGTTLAVQAHDAKGGAHAQGQATWGERAAKREQKLHDTLKLTPAQEAAWSAYTAAIKPAARPERGQRADWKALPAPERMAKRLEMARQQLAMMEARVGATTTFYGVLSPEQKKLFDEHGMQRGGHRMHRGMHS
jgi:protein CpxP